MWRKYVSRNNKWTYCGVFVNYGYSNFNNKKMKSLKQVCNQNLANISSEALYESSRFEKELSKTKWISFLVRNWQSKNITAT